ncbi:MAG: hypothetical protein SPG48_10625 [Treponema sp.]|nr:hypothetical protein [Treponema sp.]
MSEQFDNAMMLAMDAYKACNEDECKSFCNQALTVDPKSANAKALKGAAVLISFSLAGAESDAVEAIEIWKSITDVSGLTDEYKDIVINAAFDFRTRWFEAAKAHYEEFKSVNGASSEFDHVKNCYKLFMENVASLTWLQDYVKFSELTLNLVKQQIASLKEVTFAQIVVNANKDKSGKLGELAKEIEEQFGKLKKRRLTKWGIILGILVVLMIIGALSK